MKEKFDLIVIGGGTAGLKTALTAAAHDYKTALIEPGVLGGTCLNTGCIPTKTMLHSSGLFKQTKNLSEFGISASSVKADFKKIMQRVHRIINEGQEHIKVSVKNKNLTILKERASFISESEVKAGKQTLSSEKFIICTGAKPRIPSIKGIENTPYMVSDDVLKLTKLPKSIIIIGGGYIALEFATFFNELGSKVTIIEKNSRILKEMDEEVSKMQSESYSSSGVSIKTNKDVVKLFPGKIKKVIVKDVTTNKSETLSAEQILIAAGRVPTTFGLSLESAKIKKGEKGNIEINNKLQTSNPRVYAVGDVTGRAPFAHSAKRESHIALQNALENKNEEMNFDLVPWAIFTNPPIAAVGANESKLKEEKIQYGILKANYNRAGRATVIGNTEGFAKVFYNKSDNKILGAIIIGPKADELIHEFVALINCNATVADLNKVIHIHPTLSEVFEALKDVPAS